MHVNPPATAQPVVVPVQAADGACSQLLVVTPAAPVRRALYWLPAMGVPARHYIGFAQALAGHGMAVVLHEWRGIGSSDRRAGRTCDWGYRELLTMDLPAGMAAARERLEPASWTLGGHSLGGQLAVVHAALAPHSADSLLLVASGAPWWRSFPLPWNLGLRVAFAAAPVLARWCGYLPGRRIGFGGNEAQCVVADWARSGRTGHYAADGMNVDMEAALRALRLPVLALRLRDDAFGPAGSLRFLLDKMPDAPIATHVLTPEELGGRADHFTWMRVPGAVAGRIAEGLPAAVPTASS